MNSIFYWTILETNSSFWELSSEFCAKCFFVLLLSSCFSFKRHMCDAPKQQLSVRLCHFVKLKFFVVFPKTQHASTCCATCSVVAKFEREEERSKWRKKFKYLTQLKMLFKFNPDGDFKMIKKKNNTRIRLFVLATYLFCDLATLNKKCIKWKFTSRCRPKVDEPRSTEHITAIKINFCCVSWGKNFNL